MKPLTEKQVSDICDLLIKQCGLSSFHAGVMPVSLVGKSFPIEYRFQGLLGFGGKIRIRYDKWYVDNYSEDRTSLRDVIIKVTNKRLARLYKASEDADNGR